MDEPLNVWFERDTKPIWDKHLYCNAAWAKLDGKRPAYYLEIGVAAGDSMRWVLEHLQPKLCVGVDPYVAPKARMQPKYDAYKAASAKLAEQHPGRVVLFHEPSHLWLAKQVVRAEDGKLYKEPKQSDTLYDLIYVDGDHFGPAALADMVLAWRLLSVGGIMVVDDIHRRWLHGKSSVREAWRAFQDVYEDRYEYIYREPHQAAVRKVKP